MGSSLGVKLATWNINGIVKRLGNLRTWLRDAKPDIVCLQELKCAQADFPKTTLEEDGFTSIWVAEGRWNGVAILSRVGRPVLTQTELPGNPEDRQARYIEAAVNGIAVGCAYVPNGNPMPGEKYDYKLDWLGRLDEHMRKVLTQSVPFALLGDLNIAPEPRDVYATRSYDGSALIDAKCRTAFSQMLEHGLSDAIRDLFGAQRVYTFWDYRRRRFERNAGLRLDHVLLSPKLRVRLAQGGVDVPERGRENASDHAPVWIELSE